MNEINRQTQVYEAIQKLRCIVPPLSPVPDIVVIRSDRLPTNDGSFPGAPDWLIEIRSPDQNTLDLQTKILRCLSNGTQLAWLIDLQRQQLWVWENQELPLVYANADRLPTLGNLAPMTVEQVIAMTQQR